MSDYEIQEKYEAELEQKPELQDSLRKFVEFTISYNEISTEFKFHLFLEFPTIFDFSLKENKAKVIGWIEAVLPDEAPHFHRSRQALLREYKSITIADLPDDLRLSIQEARETANERIPLICNAFNMIQALYGHDNIQKYKEFESKQKAKEVMTITIN